MKKRLLPIILALLFILQIIPLEAAAENSGIFINSNAFFSCGEREFFSNSDDEDKLYCLNCESGEEIKVSDEHIITLAGINSDLFIIAYRENGSALLKFNTDNYESSVIHEFDTIINNFSIRDGIFFYCTENGVYSFDPKTDSISCIFSAKNTDLIYFCDYNTLKCYIRGDDGEYYISEISIGKNKTLLGASADEDEHILLYSNSLYTPRLTAPSTTDPYYTKLNPFDKTGYGMVKNGGNCTCYAFGRSYENLGTKPKLGLGNAGTWYDYNKKNKYYEYGSVPYLGAVAVWSKRGDSGHVAVVEVIDGNNVITSESGWRSFYFKTVMRDSSSKNFSASSGYNLLGFIYVIGKLTNEPPKPVTLTEYKTVYVNDENVSISWNPSDMANWYGLDIRNRKADSIVSEDMGQKLTFSGKLPSDIYTACISAGNYSGDSEKTFDFKVVRNIGNDFCANIVNTAGNLYLTADNNGNVTFKNKLNDNSQIWHFILKENGTYEITSVKDNKCLQTVNNSVLNDSYIKTDLRHNEPQQCWYIIGNDNSIKLNLNGTDSVLSVVDGSSAQLKTLDYSNQESFSINVVNYSLLDAPTVSINKENFKVGENTVITWNSVNGTDTCRVDVFDWRKNNVLSINTENRTFSRKLPSGKYTAYVTVSGTGGSNYGWVDFAVLADSKRLSGASRYDTAIAISEKGWTRANTVVLANGLNYADALAGVPLAYKLNAPILLTAGKSELEPEVLAQIEKLSPDNIVILGGPGVISSAIQNKLAETYSVQRIAGASRYETALKIGAKVDEAPSTAVVVTGTGYADALSVSPYVAMKGYPIVYSNPDTGLTENTVKYLESAQNIIIIGGAGVVRTNTVSQLDGKKISRISGADRYATSYKIASTFDSEFADNVMLATGADFPDALAGGVLAANLGTPLLLTQKTGTTENIKNYILEKSPDTIYILGGAGAMPSSIIDKIYA